MTDRPFLGNGSIIHGRIHTRVSLSVSRPRQSGTEGMKTQGQMNTHA